MEEWNLFQLGDFTLSGGYTSKWKIDCAYLTKEEIRTLARLILHLVGPYSSVEGVPNGGLALAAELEKSVSVMGHHLIVDDVLTTGESMIKAAQNFTAKSNQVFMGAVIFARGQCPHWVRPLFQMPECFWVKPKTRGG